VLPHHCSYSLPSFRPSVGGPFFFFIPNLTSLAKSRRRSLRDLAVAATRRALAFFG
jgi:hypothetical protein